MNLRLPIVIGIVGIAGATAVGRTLQKPTLSAPVVAFSQDDAKPQRRPAPEASAVVVYVAGAVVRGGVYHVIAGARAVDALRAAGGATTSADLVAVNLAAPLADGDEVIVPEKGAADDVVAATDGTTATHHKKRKRHRKKGHKRSHRRATQTADTSNGDVSADGIADTSTIIGDAAPAAPIDLNTAGASDLESLPGVGSKLAERIVTYRELNGPFVAHDDLLDVGGMTQKRLDAIEPFLTSL